MLIRMYACLPFDALQGVCEDFIDLEALIYFLDFRVSHFLLNVSEIQFVGVSFIWQQELFFYPVIQLLVSPVLIDKNLDKQNRVLKFHFY